MIKRFQGPVTQTIAHIGTRSFRHRVGTQLLARLRRQTISTTRLGTSIVPILADLCHWLAHQLRNYAKLLVDDGRDTQNQMVTDDNQLVFVLDRFRFDAVANRVGHLVYDQGTRIVELVPGCQAGFRREVG